MNNNLLTELWTTLAETQNCFVREKENEAYDTLDKITTKETEFLYTQLDALNAKLHRATSTEISEYLKEALDKVWWSRHSSTDPKSSEAIKRIEETYSDLPVDTGYDDWEFGFWSGVLATLRWVEEPHNEACQNPKRFLDT